MKAYLVTYDCHASHGLWLGGSCIVIANSTSEAISLVKDDPGTIEFNNVEVEKEMDIDYPRVLYNDQGDY